MIGALNTKFRIDVDQFQDFVEKYDENNDGVIDYDEFKKMMMNFH